MPRDAVIGGVLRNGQTFVPSGISTIETGDRIILFSMPDSITTVEKLFAQT